MNISPSEGRRAFSVWLRTGRLPAAESVDGVELKFNPYHDPRDGRFTFAPGGPRLPSHGTRGDRGSAAASRRSPSPTAFASFLRGKSPSDSFNRNDSPNDLLNDGVFRPSGTELLQRTAARGGPPRMGGNMEAFYDPMTLEEVFPGLRQSSAGSILSLADNVLDFTGPKRELTTDLSLRYSKKLIDEIKAVDPSYHFQSLGVPVTFKGQMNQLNDLRLDRAATFYRVRGETQPLQVETLRFVQGRTDHAYEVGTRLFEEGKLTARLSREEAVGNFVDREVRRELRNLYGRLGISTTRDQQVRVNSREYDTSGTDSTYRTPDARVGKVVFDWTLTRKTAGLAQVRGYFNADLKPDNVIIVRPSQLGSGSTYAITRPRN